MKLFSLSIAALVLVAFGFSETETVEMQVADSNQPAEVLKFTADKAHSNIGFRVRHLGITNVNGNFTDYEAVAELDPSDLSTLKAEATIQIGSISTGIERRDNHLRSDDFFNAETFPTMKFVSKEVRNIEGESFELVGDLTIRDVTKEVVLEGEFLGSGEQMGTKKVGFEVEGTISRFDYNLKWDQLTEAGGLVVAENVKIMLDLELAQMKVEGE